MCLLKECFSFVNFKKFSMIGGERVEKRGGSSREEEGRQTQSGVGQEGFGEWLLQQDPGTSER